MRWNVFNPGSTSGRSGDLIDSSNTYLEALFTFFEQNPSYTWKSNQADFFNHIKELGIIESNVVNTTEFEKTARQKTSILSSLGFVDDQRKITWLGELYFDNRQLGSISKIINNQQLAFLVGVINQSANGIFPYRAFIEFSAMNYGKPLNWKDTISKYIIQDNDFEKTIEKISKYASSETYTDFCKTIENQKGDLYNKKYYNVFKTILNNQNNLALIIDSVWSLNSKFKVELSQQLFGTSKKREIGDFQFQLTEAELFAKFLRAKLFSLVEEYSDMTKRALVATGQFRFDGESYAISEAFASVVNKYGFTSTNIINIDEIFNCKIDQINVSDEKFEKIISDRNTAFEDFLDSKLPIEKVQKYLEDISKNDFSKIRNDLGIKANNATIAEWLVTIAVHYLNDRNGSFRETWNGSLGEDCLPIYHATGRMPDAKFVINNEVVLVETTIQTSQSQTNTEIPSIFSHLEDIDSHNKSAILFAGRIFEVTNKMIKALAKSNTRIYAEAFTSLSEALKNNMTIFDFMKEKND